MKRAAALLISLLAAAAVLTGCSLLPGRTVTLAEFLSGDEFDALDAGITSGADMPDELFFFVANGNSETLDDQSFIAETWRSLTTLEISDKAAKATPTDANNIAFTFSWKDGRHYTFDFQTSDYFALTEGDSVRLHELRDSSQMGALLTSLISYLDERDAQKEANSGTIDLLNGATFSWDGNGDGVDETYAFKYYDNGDEAPNAIELSLVSEWSESVWLDGAYSITELRSEQDDWGPYLYIKYTYGDYWSHDAEADTVVRLEDGILVSYPVVGE